MIKLPPPKNAGAKGVFIEPSVAPTPSVVSTALITQSTEVVSQGRTNVKASPLDLKPVGPLAAVDRSLIPKEVEERDTKAAALALAKVIDAKVSNNNQTQTLLDAATAKQTSTFVKVTGSTDALTGKQTQDRVFRLVEKAVDPLEPAKFQKRAAPKPPGSPPVPVLRSPPRKATEEEKAAWKVPPSISNWNNSRGYVVTLDKRLAQNAKPEAPQINERFGKFAEALLAAEDAKRLEVNERAKLRQLNEEKSREAENEALRIAAAQARAARARAVPATGANAIAVTGSMHGSSTPELVPMNKNATPPLTSRQQDATPTMSSTGRGQDTPPMGDRDRNRSDTPPMSSRRDANVVDDDEMQAQRERDRIRLERKRELDRELRLAAAGKRTKAMREEERDVSERVALGMPVPKTAAAGGLEAEFDHRLFNRGETGVSSGRSADDEDNAYTAPLFRDKANDAYRPSTQLRDAQQAKQLQSKLAEMNWGDSKFVMESKQGFRGSEATSAGAAGPRTGPVQFERGGSTAETKLSGDPFTAGLRLSDAQRKTTESLESLSNRPQTTLSSGRFASRPGNYTSQPSLDMDEHEIEEDRAIKRMREKESRSKQISFVKGSQE